MSTVIAEGTLNTRPNSQVDAYLGCDFVWSLLQSQTYALLCNSEKHWLSGQETTSLIKSYPARAARIAARYARVYLEMETWSKPRHRGRFYWMGLAAFASKQVKCGLEKADLGNFAFLAIEHIALPPKWITDTLSELKLMPEQIRMSEKIRHAIDQLGKGNFWLFQDIYPWHRYYAEHAGTFETCALERNSDALIDDAKKTIDEAPWSTEALPLMGQFAMTDYLRKAFAEVKLTETLIGRKRSDRQYSSLMLIANHEQRNILQPLIYNDKLFQETLDFQASVEGVPFAPVRVAAFSVACDVEKPELREQMTKGNLYDEVDRMQFIGAIAKKYHFLMQGEEKDYMEAELKTIATWVDEK